MAMSAWPTLLHQLIASQHPSTAPWYCSVLYCTVTAPVPAGFSDAFAIAITVAVAPQALYVIAFFSFNGAHTTRGIGTPAG